MQNRNIYPQGWDEARIRRVLAHYEQQTEEEAAAEDDASFENSNQTDLEVSLDTDGA
jgi:hypothetical protein